MGQSFYTVRCTPESLYSKYQTRKFADGNPFKAKEKALKYLQEMFKKAVEEEDIELKNNIKNDIQFLYNRRKFLENPNELQKGSKFPYETFLTKKKTLDFVKILGCAIHYPDHKILLQFRLEFFDGNKTHQLIIFSNCDQQYKLATRQIELEIFKNFKKTTFNNWSKKEQSIFHGVRSVPDSFYYRNMRLQEKYKVIFHNRFFKDKAIVSGFTFAELEKSILAFANTGKEGFLFLKFENENGFFLYEDLLHLIRKLHPKLKIFGKQIFKVEDYFVLEILHGNEILKSFDGKIYYRIGENAQQLTMDTTVYQLFQKQVSNFEDINNIKNIL